MHNEKNKRNFQFLTKLSASVKPLVNSFKLKTIVNKKK